MVMSFLFPLQESWDYIGSSRIVYDMNKGKFPYEPTSDTTISVSLYECMPNTYMYIIMHMYMFIICTHVTISWLQLIEITYT